MKQTTFYLALLFLTLFALIACEDDKVSLSCDDAIQLSIPDTDTFSGIEYCPSRHVARSVEAVECPEVDYSQTQRCTDETSDVCTSDNDCVEGNKTGLCVNTEDGGCTCRWVCNSDDDCKDNEICPCPFHYETGELIVGGGGECVPADCRTNEDCPGGECAASPGRCHERGDDQTSGFFCRYQTDTCASTYDCISKSSKTDHYAESACVMVQSTESEAVAWTCKAAGNCDGE